MTVKKTNANYHGILSNASIEHQIHTHLSAGWINFLEGDIICISQSFFFFFKRFNPQNWNGKTAGWEHEIECNEPVLDHCVAAEVNKTLFVHLQFMHKSNSVNRVSSQFAFWTPTPHLQIVSVFWNRVRKRTILLIAQSVSLTIFLKISGQLCFTSELPGLRSGHDHVVLRI